MQRLREILKSYPWAVIFFAFIMLYTALDMTHTTRAYSELENRPLKTRPKLTAAALLDGKYDEAFDGYVGDQFIFRDMWITVKSLTESALLKTENNGVLYGRDDYMFGKYDMIDEERYIPNRNYLTEFFGKYPEQSISLMLVPNSYAVLRDKLPAAYTGVDQLEEISGIYAALPNNVLPVDVAPSLLEQSDEYIYYRTDHHWTTDGAYLAAREYASARALSLPPLEAFQKSEDEGFFGTYYSKAKKAGAVPDTISLYDIPVSEVRVAGEEKAGLYDMEKLKTRDKYAAFLWGNNNFTEIKATGSTENPTRVLLIKDSYGNSLAPFLSAMYDEVDVLDLRYVQKLGDYIEKKRYDDILVLYNFESLATDSNIAKLRY